MELSQWLKTAEALQLKEQLGLEEFQKREVLTRTGEPERRKPVHGFAKKDNSVTASKKENIATMITKGKNSPVIHQNSTKRHDPKTPTQQRNSLPITAVRNRGTARSPEQPQGTNIDN